MSQKRILFFESDAAFAADVSERLRRHGAHVDVTEDGNAGVDSASSSRPDLILLTIELPQVNGFLVCKKLKKSPDTASIPIIILSSEATEEIFEQHRKLRTRAEDYLRKPIAIDALMEHIRAILPLPDADDGEEEIAISEEVEVGDETPGTDLHQGRTVDPDIEAFADSAFDALVSGDDEHTTVGVIPPALAQKLAAPPPAAAPPPIAKAAPAPAPTPAPTPAPAAPSGPSPAVAELERKLRDTEASLARAENRAKAAEETAAGAERSKAEVANLEKELAETRKLASAAASGGAKTSGVSSREFLDLREALNKKDKELLDLRDQLSGKEKQLLELRDKSLGFERSIADAQDKHLEIERAHADVSDQLAAANADKDTASKRAEDNKGRAERSEARVKKLEGEVETEKAVRSADAARLNEEKQATVAALKAEHAATLEKATQAHAAALDKATQAHGAALDAATQAHEATKAEIENARAEHGQALTSAQSEHETALESLRNDHAAALERKQVEHGSAIDTAKAEAAKAVDAAKTEAAKTLDAAKAEHAKAMEAASDEQARELSMVAQQHQQTAESAKAAFEAELAKAKAEHAAAIESERNAKETAISNLMAQHEQTTSSTRENHESATAALSASHAAALADRDTQFGVDKQTALDALEGELKKTHSESLASLRAEHDKANEEMERKHGSNLAAIGRKLAESENQNTVTTEQLSEAQGELATLTKTSEERAARIKALEAQLDEAKGKIAGDAELLVRARRAMEIGLALLDEQQKNGRAHG